MEVSLGGQAAIHRACFALALYSIVGVWFRFWYRVLLEDVTEPIDS
jgi:hypothetical protein